MGYVLCPVDKTWTHLDPWQADFNVEFVERCWRCGWMPAGDRELVRLMVEDGLTSDQALDFAFPL